MISQAVAQHQFCTPASWVAAKLDFSISHPLHAKLFSYKPQREVAWLLAVIWSREMFFSSKSFWRTWLDWGTCSGTISLARSKEKTKRPLCIPKKKQRESKAPAWHCAFQRKSKAPALHSKETRCSCTEMAVALQPTPRRPDLRLHYKNPNSKLKLLCEKLGLGIAVVGHPVHIL